MPIISGSKDLSFTIAEDGPSVTISYVWPQAMFNCSMIYNLFENEICK